jgi:predicted transcriptional regulator
MKLDIATQKNGITTRQQYKLNKIMESDYEVRSIVNILFKNDKIGMLHDSKFIYKLISYALNKEYFHSLKSELNK